MDEVKSGLTFEQAKGMADRAIRDVKNGIVSAGYALKAIRSERLWEEQGFTSFDDFMERCYQKDKSWASNCIRVYEQFGELAGPEQMPRLQAKYQEYSAGGLIEMLSMPEELREQVTADMPVREIRELKREARKVATSQPEEEEQLEGQMDITDFPEFMPEPEENNVINIMDLVDEPDGVDCLDEEPAAGRQPERDLDSASSCPPGISSCIRQNWGTSEKDQEEGRKECAVCWKHWKVLNEPIQAEAVQEQQDIPEEMLPGNWHQAINGHAKAPEAPVKTGHVMKVGAEEYDRIIRGEKAYKLTKNEQKFSEGHDLELWCYKDGKFTGRKAETRISYMDEDIAGLKDGYCILGFQLISWNE